MKLEVHVQANGKDMDITNLEKEVKDKIKDANIKLNTIDVTKTYVNLNEGKVYVVLNTNDGNEIQL